MDTSLLDFCRNDFGDSFQWGVTTAAFQVEGSCAVDGKGPSIWDTFTAKKGRVFKGQNASVACDFYNRYQQDIALIRRMNIPNFRFSVAWSRLLPGGTGNPNQKGIDYYNRVIDSCLENNVTPWITAYHWDLPQALENKGGWTNRDIIAQFEDYVSLCARSFGDRVKNWIVMNEPMVFTGAGYFMGLHAPGRTGTGNFFPAVHHVVLSMSAGGQVLRYECPDARIGTTFSCSHIDPYSSSMRDVAAAHRADVFLNRLFIEPILGLGYPIDEVRVLRKLKKYFHAGDEDRLAFDFDFIGLQNYTREVVKYSWLTPYIHASIVKAEKRNVPLTEMRWEVYPDAMYNILKKYSNYERMPKIYITENGAAFPDSLENGQVHDQRRTRFIQDNLRNVLRAKREGVNVDGYFVWTLTDNFEWAEGYHPRFGLVHVDYETQKRVIKSSGKWYGHFLSGA